MASPSNDLVAVFRNRRDGSFTKPDIYPTDGARMVKLADLDCDGSSDLAVASDRRNFGTYALNLGDGTFGDYTTIPLTGQNFAVAVADGKGDADLTVGSFDDPSSFRPVAHAGCESMHDAWLDTRDLPRHFSATTRSVAERWQAAGLKVPE